MNDAVTLGRLPEAEAIETLLSRSALYGALAWLMEERARMQVPAGSMDLPLRLPKEGDGMDCAACPFASREDADAQG